MNFTNKRRILIIVAVVLVLPTLIFSKYLSESTGGIAVLMLSFSAYLVFSLFWLRCPHCNSYLGKLSSRATHCPYCGNRLE